MKYTLSLIILFSALTCFSQDVKKQESILYVVDSIPIIKDPDKSSGTLKNDDVDHLEVVTDPDKLKALGYPSIDKIIYVTTKEFVKRTPEIRKIPSTKSMERKDGVWFLKNSPTPFTGKFIDYFLSGKIEGEGTLLEGVVNGTRTVYYENGNKDYFRNYINDIADGYSEEYFINGNVKQKGSFKNGKDDGLWVEYYSTGAIKRQTNFINLIPDMSKDEKKFFDLQSKAEELMQTDDYKGAIKKLNDAEKLNSKYADIYFYRGTAKSDDFDFDDAILDFNKAIELEPLYLEALANRAFARIRKYEFKDSRILDKTNEVTILATKKKVDIPAEEKDKICADLSKSVELGDDRDLVLDAIKSYCTTP